MWRFKKDKALRLAIVDEAGEKVEIRWSNVCVKERRGMGLDILNVHLKISGIPAEGTNKVQ